MYITFDYVEENPPGLRAPLVILGVTQYEVCDSYFGGRHDTRR